MRQRDIEVIVGVLKEKCLFTVKQVTEILHRCPYVLREDPGELEYKFQVRMAGGVLGSSRFPVQSGSADSPGQADKVKIKPSWPSASQNSVWSLLRHG